MSAAAPRRVLLVGGTSEIGLAIMRRLAADGTIEPWLMGRDPARLGAELERLRSGGNAVGGGVVEVDAERPETHERAVADVFAQVGGFDLVVLAVGVLGHGAGIDADAADALGVMQVTFVGTGMLLLAVLRALRASGGGTAVVLSSVAGERVRASNAVYGAAKAGLDGLAQGLGNALAGTGVRVLIVRPGFVRTRMTAGLKPAPFATTADAVAEATVAALAGSAQIVWVPRILRPLFVVLRHLPRGLFRRLPE